MLRIAYAENDHYRKYRFSQLLQVDVVRSDELTIDYDGHDGWATLRCISRPKGCTEASLLLREQFTPQHLQEALLATGWVHRDPVQLRVAEVVPLDTLSEVAEAILSYFDSPTRPSRRLEAVKQIVDRYCADRGLAVDISLWHCAWLDLTVREDLADDARTAEDLWQLPTLTLDAACTRQRRLDELAQRFVQADKAAEHLRMAGSVRRRRRGRETG